MSGVKRLKYVITKEKGLPVVTVFSSQVSHEVAAMSLPREAVSAGFVEVGSLNGKVTFYCSGESLSLGLKPRPEDYSILEDAFKDWNALRGEATPGEKQFAELRAEVERLQTEIARMKDAPEPDTLPRLRCSNRSCGRLCFSESLRGEVCGQELADKSRCKGKFGDWWKMPPDGGK